MKKNPSGAERRLEAGLQESLACPVGHDDGALLARVRRRLLDAIRSRPSGHHTMRAAEGEWEQLAEGLHRKVLHESGGAVSALLRLAPGVVVAGHDHPIDEECLVLEGTLRIGDDLLLKAGDFHVGRQGFAHASASTDTGALVYLRGAA